jgi:hypothetical protein
MKKNPLLSALKLLEYITEWQVTVTPKEAAEALRAWGDDKAADLIDEVNSLVPAVASLRISVGAEFSRVIYARLICTTISDADETRILQGLESLGVKYKADESNRIQDGSPSHIYWRFWWD